MENKAIASPTENVSGNIQYYTIYTTVDITATGDYNDVSQRIFDNIVSLISMRAQPVVLAEPYSATQLELEGAPSLTGPGYIFKFIVEHEGIFASVDGDTYNVVDPVYHLKYMFDDIQIEGQTFYTSGGSLNIEFVQNETL